MEEFYICKHVFHCVDERYTITFNRISGAVLHDDGAPHCLWNSLVLLWFDSKWISKAIKARLLLLQ